MNINEEMELQLWSRIPFSSSEAQQRAFADPRYSKSADFRAALENKIKLTDSSIGAITSVTARQDIIYVGESGIGEGASVQAVADAEAELAARHGALAVKPEARKQEQERSAAEASQWSGDTLGISTTEHAAFRSK